MGGCQCSTPLQQAASISPAACWRSWRRKDTPSLQTCSSRLAQRGRRRASSMRRQGARSSAMSSCSTCAASPYPRRSWSGGTATASSRSTWRAGGTTSTCCRPSSHLPRRSICWTPRSSDTALSPLRCRTSRWIALAPWSSVCWSCRPTACQRKYATCSPPRAAQRASRSSTERRKWATFARSRSSSTRSAWTRPTALSAPTASRTTAAPSTWPAGAARRRPASGYSLAASAVRAGT
mmetsp:Transcript_13835/g.54666  ORF Transcript_13835/g.54666 Transcript_13835/m.54666 type:complete len:237 (-) Transcript_13835:248-958(-)